MPIAPAVGAALALGGASLASNLLGGLFGNRSTSKTNATNLQIARENNQTAIDIANRNNELSYQMFLRQLEYASPVEQRRMLEEAGYNPNLYALGASANAASAPSLQQPQLNTPTMQAPLSLAQSLTQFGQSVGSLYSMAADADLKKAQSTNQKIKNDFEVGQQVASLRSIGADAEAKDLENTYNHYTMSDRILNAKMTNEVMDADKRVKLATALHQEIQNKYADELNKKDLAQLDKAIDLLIAQGNTEQTKQALNQMGIKDYLSQIAYRETKAAIERYDAETSRIVGVANANKLQAEANLTQYDYDMLRKHQASNVLSAARKIEAERRVVEKQGRLTDQNTKNLEVQFNILNEELRHAIKDNDWQTAMIITKLFNNVMGGLTGSGGAVEFIK